MDFDFEWVIGLLDHTSLKSFKVGGPEFDHCLLTLPLL